MGTTKKPDKDNKKAKSAPKAAQNKPKTREALAEKQEPPRAAQRMQAYGKTKLVKELQEHRAEQKAEERRSEQAQAIDTLSDEAEATAGTAIDEGMGLLERDLQRLQEWRHTEPPQPPPLAETPPVSEPVYPIAPAKSDASRKMPSRQISRLPASTSIQKIQSARSIPTGRTASPLDKKTLQQQTSQLMQEHGKLLFRRKRMQEQRVKLQQRQERAYSVHGQMISDEIYPLAERSSTPAPLNRPVPQVSSYTNSLTDHSLSVPVSQKMQTPSALDRRRLVMEKRRSAHSAAEMQPSAFPAGDNISGTTGTDMPTHPFESANLSRTYATEAERKWSSMTAAPSPQARQKLLDAKRRDSRHYEVQKPPPMHILSSKERRKMVMEKRQRPMPTSAEPDFPLAPAWSNSISAAEQSLARTNFPTALQSTGFMQPPLGSGRTVAGKYAASQNDTTNAARMLPHARGGKTHSRLPAKRLAPSKTILAREKLAQSKLQVRLPRHKRTVAKTAYLRAWQISRVRQGQKVVQRGVAALTNALKKLVKAGISFTTNAGAGAFACITLLALVLMVGMAGALAGSPFGVLFSPQETSADARSVGAAVAEANNEYFGAVTDIINNTEHDSLVIHRVPNDGATDTRLRTWEEILAVFAVKTTTDPANATDVVFIDDDRTDRLKEILWDMVSVSERVEITGSGEEKTKTLHLTITVKTPEQAAQDYNFSQVQTGALTEMLLPENKALLTELIGWATGTGGAGSIGGVGNINGYEVPPEALSDERFAAMLHEAEKYLGMPYVWGGSSPSTSFDCSGFVCWVLNQSGAMSIERTTATGIYNRCTVIPKSEAKPGDLIFFTGTYNSPGPISHIGIYVGDGMMVHAGDPIQFASIESNYWKQHFYAFTRIP